jgi:AAA15 family ATPase/GTPase
MLHKITIENFFSIAEEQKLVFTIPGNAPDFLDCFKPSLSNLDIRLPVAVGFFGPNASGKSTVLRAINALFDFADHSFDRSNINASFKPYRKKEWWEKPTKISIEFDARLNDDVPFCLFRYELHIENKRKDFSNILYEALSYSPKGRFRFLFERHNQDCHFGTEFDIPNNKSDPRVMAIRKDASVLSTLAKLNHPCSIYFREHSVIGSSNIVLSGIEKSNVEKQQLLTFYNDHAAYLEELNRDLRRFDIGLESMSIQRILDQTLMAKFHHVGLDDYIMFEEESRGTQCSIELVAHLYLVLKKGSICIIDELDSDLHPLILPELLRWFSDPERNPKNAQLFFTAHNPALLNELEKEQIFFTEKPYGEATHVYSAADIKGLRREPSLMKKYLSGELGAIPHIG